MSNKFDMGDYKEVSERIQDFRKAHPEGSLQSEIVQSPFDGFIAVKGYAYRTADDPRPGVGLAWEPVPGKTPYTRDSELQNAETSAWGRAIVAVGASDASKVASADEVRNRGQASPATVTPIKTKPASDGAADGAFVKAAKLQVLKLAGGDKAIAAAMWETALSMSGAGDPPTPMQVDRALSWAREHVEDGQ